MVILITGKANAGKVEYARKLIAELKCDGHSVLGISGCEHREKEGNKDFTDNGRLYNLISAAILAQRHEMQGNIVVMSFIAPKREWRDRMRAYWRESRVVYIPGGELWPDTIYERPTDEELNILKNEELWHEQPQQK